MSTMATIQSERNDVRMLSCSRKPTITIGIVATMISHPIRTSGSPFWTPAERRPPRAPSERNHFEMIRADLPAEVDDHGELGAELRDGGERGAGIAPGGELTQDAQVRAGGDGKEFGQPLHEAEDDRLEKVHGDLSNTIQSG